MPYLVHPSVQRTYHEANPRNIDQNWGRADTFTETKRGKGERFFDSDIQIHRYHFVSRVKIVFI